MGDWVGDNTGRYSVTCFLIDNSVFLYPGGPPASVLQELEVPILNNTDCETMYRNAGHPQHIPYIFICAGYEEGGKDSCDVRLGRLCCLLKYWLSRETQEDLCLCRGKMAGSTLPELCLGGLVVR